MLLLPFFFFNDTAPTEIYPLSLHDALPICPEGPPVWLLAALVFAGAANTSAADRKSTRLNSSHQIISYAVFCLKKKHVFCSLMRECRIYLVSLFRAWLFRHDHVHRCWDVTV